MTPSLKKAYAVIGLLVGIVGLGIDAWVIFPPLLAQGRGPVDVFVYYWTYFTHLTNLGLVLVYLAAHQGEVVTREELEKNVWRGALVGYDAVTNSVIKLRKALASHKIKTFMVGLFPIRFVHTLNLPFGVEIGITLIPPVCTPLSKLAK